jgi:hypothetical protein
MRDTTLIDNEGKRINKIDDLYTGRWSGECRDLWSP